MDEFYELPADVGALRRLNVLYLLAELEQAIKLGGVAWTSEDAALPERVADLSSALRGQVSAPPASTKRVARIQTDDWF